MKEVTISRDDLQDLIDGEGLRIRTISYGGDLVEIWIEVEEEEE